MRLPPPSPRASPPAVKAVPAPSCPARLSHVLELPAEQPARSSRRRRRRRLRTAAGADDRRRRRRRRSTRSRKRRPRSPRSPCARPRSHRRLRVRQRRVADARGNHRIRRVQKHQLRRDPSACRCCGCSQAPRWPPPAPASARDRQVHRLQPLARVLHMRRGGVLQHHLAIRRPRPAPS